MKLSPTTILLVPALLLLPSVASAHSLRRRNLQPSDYSQGGGGSLSQPCNGPSDCQPLHCFVPPCDLNVCVDGYCRLEPAQDREDAPPPFQIEPLPFLCAGDEDCPPNQESCINGVCATAPAEEENSTIQCGTATCGQEEFCCNESCSTCAPIEGGRCSEMLCLEEETTNNEEEGSDNTAGEEDEEEEEEEQEKEDGYWADIKRGNCDCQELCTVCRKVFGVCIELYAGISRNDLTRRAASGTIVPGYIHT